jgi:hypothetical protein
MLSLQYATADYCTQCLTVLRLLLLLLQSALIIDILRTHQMLLEDPQFEAVKEVVFMGHSLGGACSIIAAAKVQVGAVRLLHKPA